MDQLTLGIGTRLQHTQYGPGVIVGVKYATYLISFINHGLKEIDKNDPKLDEIIPENVTEEIETHSAMEKSLLKILRLWNDSNEVLWALAVIACRASTPLPRSKSWSTPPPAPSLPDLRTVDSYDCRA